MRFITGKSIPVARSFGEWAPLWRYLADAMPPGADVWVTQRSRGPRWSASKRCMVSRMQRVGCGAVLVCALHCWS
ncbi:MAG: hypothetical protein CM1200mP14_08230 [Gammaproteobacteria bacterium]|nr:MAG: hypothetical protein CM1200mP14_08230 [Gammaproteobacteria bacterium]